MVARAAETGNWEGFETHVLCTMEGAKQLIEFQKSQNPHTFLAALTKQPFRWKQFVFRILRCEFADGAAQVETSPHDPEFVAEVIKRIEENRFHVLPYYQGFGFIAFPEDFQRYKD